MNKLLRTACCVLALLAGAATLAHAQVVWGGGGIGASAPKTAVDPAATKSPHTRVVAPMQVYHNGTLVTSRNGTDSSGLWASQTTTSLPQVPSHASGGSWNGHQPVYGGSPPAAATTSAAAAPRRTPRIEWGTPTTASNATLGTTPVATPIPPGLGAAAAASVVPSAVRVTKPQ